MYNNRFYFENDNLEFSHNDINEKRGDSIRFLDRSVPLKYRKGIIEDIKISNYNNIKSVDFVVREELTDEFFIVDVDREIRYDTILMLEFNIKRTSYNFVQ